MDIDDFEADEEAARHLNILEHDIGREDRDVLTKKAATTFSEVQKGSRKIIEDREVLTQIITTDINPA
jgi:hypothetical protein